MLVESFESGDLVSEGWFPKCGRERRDAGRNLKRRFMRAKSGVGAVLPASYVIRSFRRIENRCCKGVYLTGRKCVEQALAVSVEGLKSEGLILEKCFSECG